MDEPSSQGSWNWLTTCLHVLVITFFFRHHFNIITYRTHPTPPMNVELFNLLFKGTWHYFYDSHLELTLFVSVRSSNDSEKFTNNRIGRVVRQSTFHRNSFDKRNNVTSSARLSCSLTSWIVNHCARCLLVLTPSDWFRQSASPKKLQHRLYDPYLDEEIRQYRFRLTDSRTDLHHDKWD